MPKPLPHDVIRKLVSDLTAAPDHPRLQITITNCYLELLTYVLATNKCKNAPRIAEARRDFTQSVLITLLHEAAIISDADAKMLHWFRQRRNAAAHEVEFSVSKEHLSPFRGCRASDRKTPLDDPKNLNTLCLEAVFGFWNHHVEVFAPIFHPELFEKNG
ncbi:MAG TPA: hypothetical protein PLU30_00200 [Verrucomicrobiae bacterium]|nr:hypothetical protein [Verrucomicrobiae bacterium]